MDTLIKCPICGGYFHVDDDNYNKIEHRVDVETHSLQEVAECPGCNRDILVSIVITKGL